MKYRDLPPVGSLSLPELEWIAGNSSSRLGLRPRKVWVHRWGGGSYGGVVSYFQRITSDASSHVVYAGEVGHDAGKAAQMVRWSRKAWTEAAYNKTGISIECADAIWLGHDPHGFARTARIVAFLLHDNGLPPNWVHGATFGRRGFLRHADGGIRAGGHPLCPTTDLELWRQFVGRVKEEHVRGNFRKSWGKR